MIAFMELCARIFLFIISTNIGTNIIIPIVNTTNNVILDALIQMNLAIITPTTATVTITIRITAV